MSQFAPWSVRPLVAVSLPVFVAGCGEPEDRDSVRTATQRLLTAYVADQGETACAALSSDTVKELESEESKPCPEAIGSVQLDGGRVADVQVTVTNAKVDLATGESVFLSEQADGWNHGARMPLRGQAARRTLRLRAAGLMRLVSRRISWSSRPG